MGSIHTSINGLIISNSTIYANQHLDYNQIMAIGGTLYGITSLIGNACGGILNDKLGPNRSIFLAGVIQCLAVLSLLYSVSNYVFIFIYFLLSGLSIFLFTSTPSYVSGKLYGTEHSNSHVAILGIFLGIGFALSNSIFGFITGPTTANNIHYLFNRPTQGNIVSLEIYSILCLAIGTIIVSLCCTMILNKGIKGLLEYNPTKYSRIV